MQTQLKHSASIVSVYRFYSYSTAYCYNNVEATYIHLQALPTLQA